MVLSIFSFANRKSIASYPHPKDLSVGGNFLKPTKLIYNYCFDNKGIQENTAFLFLTFEEYSKLKEAPSLVFLESKIVDRMPFAEFCDCGLKSNIKNIENTINLLIKQKKLRSTCKVLK